MITKVLKFYNKFNIILYEHNIYFLIWSTYMMCKLWIRGDEDGGEESSAGEGEANKEVKK